MGIDLHIHDWYVTLMPLGLAAVALLVLLIAGIAIALVPRRAQSFVAGPLSIQRNGPTFMNRESRAPQARSSLVLAGAIAAIVMLTIALWLFWPLVLSFFLSSWYFVNGYDVHVHY